ESGWDSERGEDERGSRRPPREAREAMQRVRIRRLAETLDLDEQETEKVVQRIEAHEEQYRELQRELGEARHELRRALREDADEDTISEKLDKALELEGKRILHQRDGYREITEDFNVKQQARFYLFMPEFEEDMRRLVERARDLRRMPPAFHEKLKEMDRQERREFFREHELFPGRRGEGEAAPDERRRERPEARREETEGRSRGRREGIGEEEREAVRERVERMVENMDEVEAEQWRERLERLFEFVSEEVPEAWQEGIRELRERWEERRGDNSEEAEGSARKDDVWEERLPWMGDRRMETVRKLREHWPEMSRSERRELLEERFQRLHDVGEEDVRRFVREGPGRSFPRVGVEGRAQDTPRPREGEMERLRELGEKWGEMSRSERRELLEERFQRLDDVSEEDVRRFVREGPGRSFPRLGVEGRAQDTPRPREGEMERLRELGDKWAEMSPSERRERFEECFQRLDDVSEEDVRRFVREGPDRPSPRGGVDARP
ncbi:MAG: hypothetical protein R6W89_02595, partial [Candidatus Hydrogenedentota bacterium]